MSDMFDMSESIEIQTSCQESLTSTPDGGSTLALVEYESSTSAVVVGAASCRGPAGKMTTVLDRHRSSRPNQSRANRTAASWLVLVASPLLWPNSRPTSSTATTLLQRGASQGLPRTGRPPDPRRPDAVPRSCARQRRQRRTQPRPRHCSRGSRPVFTCPPSDSRGHGSPRPRQTDCGRRRGWQAGAGYAEASCLREDFEGKESEVARLAAAGHHAPRGRVAVGHGFDDEAGLMT